MNYIPPVQVPLNAWNFGASGTDLDQTYTITVMDENGKFLNTNDYSIVAGTPKSGKWH
jgi:hypothetical protein